MATPITMGTPEAVKEQLRKMEFLVRNAVERAIEDAPDIDTVNVNISIRLRPQPQHITITVENK